jgi:hypothetical protein
MKKTLTYLGALLLLALGGLDLQAQMARKQPMLEHFTQASCGPCASQNPLFEPVRLANLGLANHAAYHTSWPGTDPMYSANPAENNAMVGVYGVTGVPSMIMDGTNLGGPTNVTEQRLFSSIADGSPIRLRVEETGTTSRNVTVHIDGIAAPPSGSHILRVLVLEDPINYASPPGSNGERDFPNVFRQTLGGTAGTAVTLPAAGSSISFPFSYTVSGSWNESNVFVVAYVQNTTTREVLNSASSRAPRFDLSLGASERFQSGSSAVTFRANLEEFGSGPENLTISLVSDQPGDWSSSFTYQGNTYSSSTTTTINGGDVRDITVNVSPTSTSGIGEYILQVRSNDEPSWGTQVLQFIVVNNVTDLIVNSDDAFGNGTPPGTYDTEVPYTSGLDLAARSTTGRTGHLTFIKALEAGALNNVLNIYYNASWTFPSLSNDRVEAFTDFLDRGGNLFLSGQDIGWEIMDSGSPFGTPVNRQFFLNYLEASYDGDGNTGTTTLEFVAADPWLGAAAAPGSSGITALYGASNVYPDEISPNGPEATSIMYYNGNPSRSAGIRTEKNDYKVVYLGTGLEMFSNDELATLVVKLVHDYFWDGLSGLEFDALLSAALMGQNMPNPASDQTLIPLYEWNERGVLRLSDLQGRTVREYPVQPGQNLVQVELNGLPNGLYTYTLSNGQSQTPARKLTVLR